MPMRIVNLKAGSGPAPAPTTVSESGLYKIITGSGFTNLDPSSSKYIHIWDANDRSMPRPESIIVMVFGQPCWNRSQSQAHPPDCGAAFGIATLKGDDIPEKLYAFRGSHNNYPYTYPKNNTFGFSKTVSRDGAWLLPNMAGNHMFTNADFVAPDAKVHHWGEWDYIANGGNGKFTQYASGFDSCGSNGSMFGDGKTSTGKYPSSCGNSGTDSARGRLAQGIEYNSAFDSLKSVLPFALEKAPTPPSGTNINDIGGNGGVDFMLTENVEFGLANGVPFIPAPVKISLSGGNIPFGRMKAHSTYSPIFNILCKY